MFKQDLCAACGGRGVMLLRYLVLVALLIDGYNEFGDVRDELIAFGFPQRLHADLEVFDQDFL